MINFIKAPYIVHAEICFFMYTSYSNTNLVSCYTLRPSEIWLPSCHTQVKTGGKYKLFICMKFRVFWDVLPCYQFDVKLRTRQYTPEDSELHTGRHENLKTRIFICRILCNWLLVSCYIKAYPKVPGLTMTSSTPFCH
jgi:hypothetical protein